MCGLAEAGGSPKMARWTLVGVDIEGALGKYRVHKKLTTLGQLLNHEGYVEFTPELLAVLKNQYVDVDYMVATLVKAGKSLRSITKPISKEQMAFQVFGK